jgi:hypothetical protein
MPPPWELIARRVASRWSGHAFAADALSAALLAGWEFRDENPALIVTACQKDVIDELRHVGGRRGGYRYEGNRVTTPSITHDIADTYSVEDDLPVSLLYGLSGRLAVIAEALAVGRSKVSIAAELGVDPSRVSQLIADLRAAINPEGEPWTTRRS